MAQTQKIDSHDSSDEPTYKIRIVRTDEEKSAPKRRRVRHTKKHKFPVKLFILSFVFLIIAVAVTFSVFVQSKGDAKSPIPQSLQNSVSFQLYFPTTMPSGYSIDPVSIHNSNGTIFLNLVKNPGDPPIVISQQAVPKDFDPKSMFQHNPLPSTITKLGTVYDLSYKNQSRYMVTAPNSLVFISSNSKVSSPDVQKVINGLKRSNQ